MLTGNPSFRCGASSQRQRVLQSCAISNGRGGTASTERKLELALMSVTCANSGRSTTAHLRDTQSAALVPAPEHRLIVFLVSLRLYAIFKPGFDLAAWL